MTTESFQAWLARRPKGPAPKKPIPKRTPTRAAQERRYRVLAKFYLGENPVDEVWLKENGWKKCGLHRYTKGQFAGIDDAKPETLFALGAPRSEVVHHRNKRRGEMLCKVEFFFAVSIANHQRIEDHKDWARAEGYLLNF